MSIMQEQQTNPLFFNSYVPSQVSHPAGGLPKLSLHHDPMLSSSLLSPLTPTFRQENPDLPFGNVSTSATFQSPLRSWLDSAQDVSFSSFAEFAQVVEEKMRWEDNGMQSMDGGIGLMDGIFGTKESNPEVTPKLIPSMPYHSPPLTTYDGSPPIPPALVQPAEEGFMLNHSPYEGQELYYGETNGAQMNGQYEQYAPLDEIEPTLYASGEDGQFMADTPDLKPAVGPTYIQAYYGYPSGPADYLWDTLSEREEPSLPSSPRVSINSMGGDHKIIPPHISEDEPQQRQPPQGPRIYRCRQPDCTKAYGTGAGLRYHLRHFHKMTELPRMPPVRIARIKPDFYDCLKCGKRYTTAAGLRYHKKTFVHS